MDFTNTTKNPVVLSEKNRRFALDPGSGIHGYIRLQTDGDRGIITATAENLKVFPHGEYTYKLIFTGVKKEKRYYYMAGDITLAPDGTGEGSFRINPADMNGQGLALSDCSDVIVAAMSRVDPREALHPVMSGSIAFPRSIAETSTGTSAAKKTPRDYSPFYSSFVLDSCIKIAQKQNSFADIKPFTDDYTGAVWKKITDVSLFPMISPGSEPPMKKYGHFLFGWQDTHYFLGVPGRFLPEEQPDSGKSGFVFWQPIIDMQNGTQSGNLTTEERRKRTYGYWIASINRFNGHIEETPRSSSDSNS